MSANDRQVGGKHYQTPIQHWDYVLANDIPYMEGQIIKYLVRWRKKGGLQDLHKARHYLDKLIEHETAKTEPTTKLPDPTPSPPSPPTGGLPDTLANPSDQSLPQVSEPVELPTHQVSEFRGSTAMPAHKECIHQVPMNEPCRQCTEEADRLYKEHFTMSVIME